MAGLETEGLANHPVVEVLLATFNGGRFLREQIDSILAQDYTNLRILARDDGSSDETGEILNEYAERFPNRFRTMPSSRGTGNPKDNFLLLMRASTAQYICFSDQDDVWLPDKVSKTMRSMNQLLSRWGDSTPLLVFTDLHVVDSQLRMIHESFWKHERIDPGCIDRLTRLLGQNVVTGCTAMLNRRLLDISLEMPEGAHMHDRWIGLLASAMGKAGIVRSQTVLYRQHDRNVFGAEKQTGLLPDLARRMRNGGGRELQWEISQRQAAALLQVHRTELTEKNRNILTAYLRCGTSRSRFVRIGTLIRYGFFRVGMMRNVATLIHLWTMKVDDVD